MKREEEELVEAARRGDRAATCEVLRRVEPLVDALVRRWAGAALLRFASPEDLRQEVLAGVPRAFEHLRAGAEMEDVRALLVQHVRWVLSRHGRRAQRFQGESVVADPREEPGRDGASTGIVTAVDEAAWLKSLVRELDPAYRTVVELRMQGLAFAEIGAALELEEDTARWRYLKAAERLRLLARSRAAASKDPRARSDR